MRFNAICFIPIVILFGSGEARASKDVAVGPLNDAHIEGDQVLLQCEATGDFSRISWLEYASGNPYGRLLSDGENILETHPNAERYAIIHDGEFSYDLLINSTVLADGGTYRCLDQEDPVTETAYAELILLRGDPVCVSSTAANGEVIEGRFYSIECSVDYHGNIAPIMTWTGPRPFTVETSTTNDTVSSKLTFLAIRIMSGSHYSCQTNFTADEFESLPADYATNVPAYVYSYEGVALDVYYCTGTGPTTTLMQESDGSDGAFNRSWAEFKEGFSTTNYQWLGNDNINTLTAGGNCRARFEVQAKSNGLWYMAEYNTFQVGDESTGYQIDVSGYSGNASDAMSDHNGMKFSTDDRDNDNSVDRDCATLYAAGWWFDSCCEACINLPASGGSFIWWVIPGEALTARVWLICN